MRFYFLSLLVCISCSGFSQLEITHKNLDYFELNSIENNEFQNQILVSASLDEFGWNGEWYKIKKNIFSINSSITFKRLLPNLGEIWTPITLQWVPVFPQNGIMLSAKGRWYFNQRKFSFAGLKLYGGFLWLKNKEMFGYISSAGTSDSRFILHKLQSYRYGFDLTAGRKFINKFISELSVEAGYRLGASEWSYQCKAFCNSGGNDGVIEKREKNGMFHFQVFLGFIIFSE